MFRVPGLMRRFRCRPEGAGARGAPRQRSPHPMSSALGTCATVEARLWPWLKTNQAKKIETLKVLKIETFHHPNSKPFILLARQRNGPAGDWVTRHGQRCRLVQTHAHTHALSVTLSLYLSPFLSLSLSVSLSLYLFLNYTKAQVSGVACASRTRNLI